MLAIAGEIDIATAGVLEDALEAIVRSTEREVWVDLSEVAFMDSTGLHALLRARDALTRDQRRLAVIAPPGQPRRAIRLAGLDTAFSSYASRSTAHHRS